MPIGSLKILMWLILLLSSLSSLLLLLFIGLSHPYNFCHNYIALFVSYIKQFHHATVLKVKAPFSVMEYAHSPKACLHAYELFIINVIMPIIKQNTSKYMTDTYNN
jgi:hypothetical protein